MENNYQIFVGGEFKETDNVLSVTNPFNNKVVAETFLAGEAELEEAINKAISVQDELTDLPSWRRYDILMQIADQMRKQRNAMAKIISLESAPCMTSPRHLNFRADTPTLLV